MKLTIIQHVPFETPGLITNWAQEHHIQTQLVKLYENNDQLPDPATVDFLIVMGGPMSANDELEWIKAERQLIRAVVAAHKPMLGICLGAQQLAKAYGQPIIPTPKEVGFGMIETSSFAKSTLKTLDHYQVLHWHGEGFETPKNAIPLFSSPNWHHQGFILGSAIGLQFHLETTPQTLKQLVRADTTFIPGSQLAKNPQDILKIPIDPGAKKLLDQILSYLSQLQDN